MDSSGERFVHSWEGYLVIISWNKHQYSTRVSAKVVRHERWYIILFHDITNPEMKIKRYTLINQSIISSARFKFWWWRSNRLVRMSQMHYAVAVVLSPWTLCQKMAFLWMINGFRKRRSCYCIMDVWMIGCQRHSSCKITGAPLIHFLWNVYDNQIYMYKMISSNYKLLKQLQRNNGNK